MIIWLSESVRNQTKKKFQLIVSDHDGNIKSKNIHVIFLESRFTFSSSIIVAFWNYPEVNGYCYHVNEDYKMFWHSLGFLGRFD